MTDAPDAAATPTMRYLRYLAMLLGNAQTWFWLYTFRLIYVNPPKGDGMGWFAVIPFALIFFALIVPTLRLSINERRIALSAVLAVAALILNVLLTIKIADDSANPFRF